MEGTINRFNLVDEPWIPVADFGLASLKQIFSDSSIRTLNTNPVQKIALMKLLLAIAQAAFTPNNNKEWIEIGFEGMAKKTVSYLDEKRDLFFLYGAKPFLQMKEISSAKKQGYGAVHLYIASGNNTVLNQSQVDRELTDAEKAQLLIFLMGFAPGGKQTDNSIVLSKNYNGKNSSGKPGSLLGSRGYLHTLLTGKNMIETLWLNILTKEQISDIRFFSSGIGVPPWEKMPVGEDCETARKLKSSYMGRLVPMSRFVLFKENDLHYSEGIAHPELKEGGFDPTIAVDFSTSTPKVLWVDPEKRPWRQLVAMLSFFSSERRKSFDCRQLKFGLIRVREAVKEFGIWSGGINLSNKAGEQYATGNNDFVESEITLYSKSLGYPWFSKLKDEMNALEDLSNIIDKAIKGYYRKLKADRKTTSKLATLATNLYWQLCEQNFQDLLDACDDNTGIVTKDLRQVFAKFVNKAYNAYCPQDTARQLDAWASNRPFINKYLNDK